MQLTSKLPNVATTIFAEMSALALQHRAINLGQGFPDYQMDENLIALVNEAMKDGMNQYTSMQGWMPLRESIAEKIEKLYSTKINADSEITITPGGTYAIYTIFTTILQPNDEVIIFEPAYDSYIPNIEINGAKVVAIDLEFPSYNINWDEVKKKINPKTKAIIINTPQNPTGAVLQRSDWQQLNEIVKGTNIFIISDEVYEHIIFDGIKHQSVLAFPELYERSFVVFSFGKTYNCTGWKLGYCVASPKLTQEFRKVHQYNAFCCFTPTQIALANFLKTPEHYLGLSKKLQAKRDYFVQLMKETKFTMQPTYGSYFICGTYEKISDEGDKDFAVRITKEFGVATIPVSSFYQRKKDDKIIRFCFSKKESTLEQAVERLRKIV